MTRRHRTITLIVAAALIVAACSDGDTPEATTASTTVATPAVPSPSTSSGDVTAPTTSTTSTTDPSPTSTTTTPPATTVDQAPSTTEAPASTDPGEPDWLSIVTDLSNTINEITVDPAPDRIEEVAIVGGEWERVTGSAIRNSAEQGHRTIGLDPLTVVSAVRVDGVIDEQTVADLAAVDVTVLAPDLSEAFIIDEAGDVVFELVNDAEPGTPSTATWLLQETDAGWRIVEIRSTT